MKDNITIMASNGGILNAYKVFNVAISAATMNKQVSIFFNFDAIKFIVKPKYYNLLEDQTLNFSSKDKNYGLTPLDELIKVCKELEVKFFVISYGMKMTNVEEYQLLDGTIIAAEATFLDNAEDSIVVLNF